LFLEPYHYDNDDGITCTIPREGEMIPTAM